MKFECKKCGKCCKTLYVKTSLEFVGNDDMIDFLKKTRLMILSQTKDGDIEMHLEFPCNFLSKDQLCNIYDSDARPAICKAHKCNHQ